MEDHFLCAVRPTEELDLLFLDAVVEVQFLFGEVAQFGKESLKDHHIARIEVEWLCIIGNDGQQSFCAVLSNLGNCMDVCQACCSRVLGHVIVMDSHMPTPFCHVLIFLFHGGVVIGLH